MGASLMYFALFRVTLYVEYRHLFASDDALPPIPI
jgi:hypothetical protein